MSKQHDLIHDFAELRALFCEVEQELIRAERKFPQWPDDLIHGCAIMAEEAGESVRACLQIIYGGGFPSAYRQELIQTAAMAVRAVLDLDRRDGEIQEWMAKDYTAQTGREVEE